MVPIRISVITVTFQAEKYIPATIQSVQNQSARNFEWIVIDGASTDDTVNRIKRAQASLSIPVRVISESDKGIYDAMNKAIHLAKGEFLYFLNAGDSFASDDVLSMVSDKLMPGINIFPVQVLYPDGKSRILIADRLVKLWKGMPFSHQGMIYSIDVLRKHAFATQERIVGDFVQLIESVRAGEELKFHTQVLACYLAGGVSDTERLQTVKDMERIVRKYQLCSDILRVPYYGYHKIRSKFVCFVRQHLSSLYVKLHT